MDHRQKPAGMEHSVARILKWFWRVMLLAVSCAATQTAAGGLHVSSQTATDGLTLVDGGVSAQLYVDSKDIQPAELATGMLAQDIQRVTGVTPKIVDKVDSLSEDVVAVGTIGHSAFIDELIAKKTLDVSTVEGQWEAYGIQVVDNPTPTVRRALVIVGSDRRGTAYGVVTVSQAIGVSPWYWWADVPISRKKSLFISITGEITDKPVVKYRGIFLNDEAPCLSGWAKERFGGLNHDFYVNVFELLLRLKANYLWPAMWNNCFNEDDTRNPELANTYGIVMGTSHVEPMMRADKEWNRLGYTQGQWNYEKSQTALQAFWKAGLERNKPFENVITMAMRGKIDTPMSETANIALLERIVADQRKLIANVINPDVTKVPQLWALYKEVQEYYDKGMRVPEDVTLLWCDDNWGNIRRLPTPEERNRSGGAGIYYHFDYVGGPRNYKWLNTVPITKTWEQMNIAHHYGANRIWIVNVGDLKPLEFPMEFFLTMAWNPERWTSESVSQFGRDWSAREFGPEHAEAIADIVAKYTKYNGRRKPEQIEPGTYSLTNYGEADRVAAEWQAVTDEAEKIDQELPPEARDAFYQLVLYPTKASATVTELDMAVGKNHLYTQQGRASANDMAALARRLFEQDRELSDTYNHKITGGKWDHMMDQTHISYTGWQQPSEDVMPAVTELTITAAASMGVAVEGMSQSWPGAADGAVLSFESWHDAAKTIDIFNRGGARFHYTITSSSPWVVVSPPTGEVDKTATVSVAVDWSKTANGMNDGEITIVREGQAPVVVSVHASHLSVADSEHPEAFIESDGCVSIEAEHFAVKHAGEGATWERIDGFGRTLSAMTVIPVTAASAILGKKSASLEYGVFIQDHGHFTLDAIVAPSLNFVPGRGLRYAVSVDDKPPQVVDILEHNSLHDWETAVSDGVRHSRSEITLETSGYHVLKFWQVDPGVVLEKLILDCGGVKPSYLGPPESSRQARR